MKLRGIEITFPTEVELPDGFEKALHALVEMVCDKYEREHPTEVMWPSGHGSKMLTHPGMVDDDHPLEFDDSVYCIEVTTRDDYYGQNEHNPDRDKLKAAVARPPRWKQKLGEFAEIANVTRLMQMLPMTRETYTREDVANMLAAHQDKMNQGLAFLLNPSSESVARSQTESQP